MNKYHEDTVKKHKITQEELNFLKELQKEMNTQDTVSQADPRFWVVATDKHEELGTEECFDVVRLYCSDDCETVCDGDMSSIIKYIKENYYDELNKENITFEDKDTFYHIQFGKDENCDEYCVYDSNDLLRFLKNHNIIADSYELVYYQHIHYIYPNTMFLTNRSCKEHIKTNYYHYNEDAHSYAMTAWRSPEVSKLFKILQEVDWDNIIL